MARNKTGANMSSMNGHRVTRDIRCQWGGLGTGEHRCDEKAKWCQYVRHAGGVSFFYYCGEHQVAAEERRRELGRRERAVAGGEK